MILDGSVWSVKTVQNPGPFEAKALRFISGRNSPDYSLGISDPREDIQATGKAVLSIWNSRINEVLSDHKELRIVALVRNMITREFVLFEDEAERFIPANYRCEVNNRDNLEGFEIGTGERCFTWQPHGAQFTIHRIVPASACKFKIAQEVPLIEFEHILGLTNYNDDWIEFQN